MVARHYALDPVEVTLLRSFNNDVFRIDARDGRYVLKVYGANRVTADEVRWEQEFARHLVEAGVAVAADVRLLNGDTVGTLEAPEGSRPYAMAEWVPGTKPAPPWTNDLYRAVGAALAHLHNAADSFTSPLPRREIRVGNEPEQVLATVDSESGRRHLIEVATKAARAALEECAERGLRQSFRHGDPSLDNLHVDSEGRVHFYDLDLAAPGWPIEDLTGALTTDHAVPFLDGYTAVRTVEHVELDALPWLGLLARIDNLKFHLIDKPTMLGTASLSEGWVDGGFESLEREAANLGLI